MTFRPPPIKTDGKAIGNKDGLPSAVLQPLIKLIALPLTLWNSLVVTGVSPVLAQWEVVYLTLEEQVPLKPFPDLIQGRSNVLPLWDRCITALQTVVLLRGPSPTARLVTPVDPAKPLASNFTPHTAHSSPWREGPKLLTLGTV